LPAAAFHPYEHSMYFCKKKSNSTGLTTKDILQHFSSGAEVQELAERLMNGDEQRLLLKGMKGSQPAFVAAALLTTLKRTQVFVLPDKESAAYFQNDLETLFDEREMEYQQRRVLFLPASRKRPYEAETPDRSNLLMRSEVLNKIQNTSRYLAVVTYPEALGEKVTDRITVGKNTLKVSKGDQLTLEFMTEFLAGMDFEQVDFVAEPGQYAVRGGIVDVFSFSNDHPFRIEFFGNEIDSIRSFDPGNQLSLSVMQSVSIMPNVQSEEFSNQKIPFTSYIPKDTVMWFDDLQLTVDRIAQGLEKAKRSFDEDTSGVAVLPESLYISADQFLGDLLAFSVVEFGGKAMLDAAVTIQFDADPQPSFNKNFDLLINNLNDNTKTGTVNIIFAANHKQAERIHAILDDTQLKKGRKVQTEYATIARPVHSGFTDHKLKIACYCDHQIFDRYHRFHLRESIKGKEALTLKEIYNLQPGDFVTHIDHGVGRFDGLETIENNGRQQEAIRLVYRDSDLLYVSIHSLHRIAKFVGKEGIPPSLNKLGTNNWNRLKERTKKKVKDIAKDLIKLYAERKSAKGFAFSPDSYMQHELEASFIYEDTPDQLRATIEVKKDLQKDYPMDRLVCGDVGFGKTEVAIRAAFKAATDGKQAAVLVPTTILALQHFKTFSGRLDDFPVTVEYINRFKTAAEQRQIIKALEEGRIDILIGTHRLVGKDVKFKDLGLMIVDEEQKFGVAIKEKLKKLKVNVDTLTLTATPIPRTLQFSLMGARDLSVINTPPPNRIPIHTEVRGFGEEVISSAINYEIARNGQVFFVHNRVQNINDVAEMIHKFCPGVKIGIGHGQMDGKALEQVMLEFIEGDFDVLVATTIVENGLDIPNANTIIINDAQNFGLSDLHQLRGRVGRANKQAFCYLLSPPLSTLTNEARKRLKAIEEFSSLGSGFNIAMRDLDIRGAGNMLGAEQSGFISDIGFEMYNKILDEAILELREEEFRDVFAEKEDDVFVKDCQIETDMELLIPKDYISVTSERLSLYKELDNASGERELQQFEERLIDRFGPVPEEVTGLFDAIRLRWMAKKIGFEKIVLKNNRLIGFFTGSEDSSYYNSPAFTHVLNFIKNNPRACIMRENKQKLSLIFNQVHTIQQAIKKLTPLVHNAGS
jgi:transcription-repair coupling factor (superfamily II helicase)